MLGSARNEEIYTDSSQQISETSFTKEKHAIEEDWIATETPPHRE